MRNLMVSLFIQGDNADDNTVFKGLPSYPPDKITIWKLQLNSLPFNVIITNYTLEDVKNFSEIDQECIESSGIKEMKIHSIYSDGLDCYTFHFGSNGKKKLKMKSNLQADDTLIFSYNPKTSTIKVKSQELRFPQIT